MSNRTCAIFALVALSACTTPAPVIQYRTVTAPIPPALLAQEPAPAVPECTTQGCVSDYLVDLHEFALEGWAKLAAVAKVVAPPAGK